MEWGDFKDCLEVVEESEYDFGGISSSLRDVEKKEQEMKQKGVEDLVKTVNELSAKSSEKPMEALPVQEGYSLQFHHAVVNHYEKRHQILSNPKDEFQRRKAKRRISRQKKKGTDYHDRKQAKTRKDIAKKRRK